MPTGPSQSDLPLSSATVIDGVFIAEEDLTITTSGTSSFVDIGKALFRGSVIVEITSSSDILTLKVQGADDTGGTNTVDLEQLVLATSVTGRFRLNFSNAAQGSLKSAIRLSHAPTVAGPIVVKIAYFAKGQNDPTM